MVVSDLNTLNVSEIIRHSRARGEAREPGIHPVSLLDGFRTAASRLPE
jgi:hypothetical protein